MTFLETRGALGPLCGIALVFVLVLVTGCDEDCARRLTCEVASGSGGGGAGGGTGAVGGSGGANAANGEPCVDAMLCSSGFCAQGVCCNAVCDGECETCAAAGNEGKCSSVAAGDDPYDSCAGGAVCGSRGGCDYGGHVYSTSFGDVERDVVREVAVGPNGNVSIVGWYMGGVGFGGAQLPNSVPSAGYLATFDSAGVHQSSTAYAASTSLTVDALASRNDGGSFFAGGFRGTASLGSAGNIYGSTVAPSDAFMGSADVFGDPEWAVSLATTALGPKPILVWKDACSDAQGNVVVVATLFNASVDVAGVVHSGDNYSTGVAIKFGETGQHMWTKFLNVGAGGDNELNGVSCDGNDILLAGNFTISLLLGNGVALFAPAAAPFVARLSSDGTPSWAVSGTTSDSADAATVIVGVGGSVFVGGSYTGALGWVNSNATSQGAEDAFLLKLTASGVVSNLWSYGTASPDELTSLAIDSAGNLLVGGHTTGAVNFGGGDLLAAGGQDIVVAKLTPDGEHIWSRIFGGMGDTDLYRDTLAGVAVGADDTTILAGTIGSSFSFGGSTLAHQGKGDVFLAILGP